MRRLGLDPITQALQPEFEMGCRESGTSLQWQIWLADRCSSTPSTSCYCVFSYSSREIGFAISAERARVMLIYCRITAAMQAVLCTSVGALIESTKR